ncbi:MAG: hypothetical protein QOF58_675, partial [Pseudonocardiales bacterium]|nr:hypothetical protein [Pseudonocardiales bacterium]
HRDARTSHDRHHRKGTTQIAQKVFVVTDGGNGIGRDIVRGLIGRGAWEPLSTSAKALEVNYEPLPPTQEVSGQRRASQR